MRLKLRNGKVMRNRGKNKHGKPDKESKRKVK